MKRILFITPPYHAGVVEVAGRWVPLHLVYLAGAARASGWEPIIYDAMTKGVGHGEIGERIEEVRPHCVATSAITSTLMDALAILRTAKDVDHGIKTILGGIHPTFMWREVFSLSRDVDFIVRGEGERTLMELLTFLEEGGDPSRIRGIAYKKDGAIVTTPERPLMDGTELDTLPKAWDLLDWEDYEYFILPGSRLGAIDTSRGCNRECSFCSQRRFWKGEWRARTPEALAGDLETLKERFGVDVVLLTDDYPTFDRVRWERFLDLLIERDLGLYILMETRVGDILRDVDILPKYREAGIIHIYVGTESTDQKTLDFLKKGLDTIEAREALRLLDEHGIVTETSMILGFPWETRESIERTLSLAIDYNPDFCHFLAITPWPYADLYKELKDRIAIFDYRRYNLITPVVRPVGMSLEEVDRAIVDCYRRFYMGKLREVLRMEDPFKRRYLLYSMKLMMRSSFLVNKIGSLGSIPQEVEEAMAMIDTSLSPAAGLKG